MDHSLNCSSRGIVGGSRKPSGSDGESGWTSYFEDFSEGIEPSYCSSLDGSSLLSDAASSAAWKFSHHNHHHHHLLSSPSFKAPNPPKKLTFKKARAKQISEDDPLEDTASSPVNSPKVRDLNPAEMSSRKDDDDELGKGLKSSEHYSDKKRDDKLKYNGKNGDCTELKKRGLCLVPLSLLVNYLG
ncbi:hypothetical protein LR48_Vigan08g118400 [Vigna angularis]|uniref:Putative vascular-related protein n=1 Tax=Phaseolus angularis TaxID=3914 RepID=A0A0L9V5X2_PHAAN|nr:vascular-related unknown protein 1 [Vigna angularis]KAG2397313.1 putative vascular-related protein [Vigna angularis]KOM50357.1 hypothetical protein LR48_Vigan08g118400 [Vigna angularis]